MKIILISDNIELLKISKLISLDKNECQEVIILTADKIKRFLYDVAIEVKNLTYEEDDDKILLIEQYLSCADIEFQWLQLNSGIALIKFLRMMDVKHHIVLLTPYTKLELIEQNPNNLIVSSRGVSTAKYLFEFSKKTLAELRTLAKEKFENQDLRPYIITGFRFPEDERHNWANWWGIDRLWNIHYFVIDQGKNRMSERWEMSYYPSTLKNKIKQLRNFQSIYLYGYKGKFIHERIMQLNKEIIDISIRIDSIIDSKHSFISEQANLKAKIQEADDIDNELKRLSDIQGNDDKLVDYLLDRFLKESARQRIMSSIQELETLIVDRLEAFKIANSLKDGKENDLYFEYIKTIGKLQKTISSIKTKSDFRSISDLRTNIQSRPPCILYIDDQASEGWSIVFQHIIYNRQRTDLFIVIQPADNEQINEEYFSNVIYKKIIECNPDIIFLDLRLKGETGTYINVDKLSGTFILRKIKEFFPKKNVIIVTASNKIWSYEELKSLGCGAFWTKEGLDTFMTEEDSAKNYLHFLEIVNDMTSDNLDKIS
jgi:hypothetical protein